MNREEALSHFGVLLDLVDSGTTPMKALHALAAPVADWLRAMDEETRQPILDELLDMARVKPSGHVAASMIGWSILR